MDFQTIPREKCKTSSQKILESSENKWVMAKMIAKSNAYGEAISIHIISSEELIKAIILAFDSMGFEFRKVKEINAFFKNHEWRYFLAFFLFAFGSFVDDLSAFLKMYEGRPGHLVEYITSMIRDDQVMEKNLKSYLTNKIEQLYEDLAWFSGVDARRQNGFYSDYRGGLRSPQDIQKSEYDDVYNRLASVRTMGKAFIKILGNESIVSAQINALVRDFKLNNRYLIISAGMKQLREHRKKPFEFLLQAMAEKMENGIFSAYQFLDCAVKTRKESILSGTRQYQSVGPATSPPDI